MDELWNALAAIDRVRTMTHGLDQSAKASDLLQVAAGIQHELTTARNAVASALRSLQGNAVLAAADRPGKVRGDAPATSQATAQAITVRSGSQRGRILRYLSLGGRTDLQIQENLVLSASSERPRRGELVDAGLVTAIGTRRHGDTDWTIWGVTIRGLAVADLLVNQRSVMVRLDTTEIPQSTCDDDVPDPTLF